MIQIKGHYTGWKEADRATAARFIKHKIAGILVGDQEYKTQIIEKNHLRGITVRELLEVKK